jgi:hypothetical protein
MRRVATALALLALALCGALYAQQAAKPNDDPEPDIRRAAFGYYFGMATGDADGVLRASASPVHVLRDGAMAQRDEKKLRALLDGVAQRLTASGVTPDERGKMAARAVAVIDAATLQYIGARTATLALVVRAGATKADGDQMMELVLHQSGGRWRVVQEITDSAAVPASRLEAAEPEADTKP